LYLILTLLQSRESEREEEREREIEREREGGRERKERERERERSKAAGPFCPFKKQPPPLSSKNRPPALLPLSPTPLNSYLLLLSPPLPLSLPLFFFVCSFNFVEETFRFFYKGQKDL
jgi:hypothetical protein